MNALADGDGLARRAAVNRYLVDLIRGCAIVLGIFLSGFVLHEPAPYELYMAGLMAVWAVFGLRISRSVAPLLGLLILFNIGGLISMSQLADLGDVPLYLAVSLFLAITAVFFAAVIEAQPNLLQLIFKGWMAAAVLTAICGILGYFQAFPGAEVFTRYGRASGAFEDPNVFGPFITLPGIYLLHRMMTGSARAAFLAVPPFLIIVLGVFLSFSRGAWGLFLATSLMLVLALFIQNRRGLIRLRILAMCIAAGALVALALLVALQIPDVADLFMERARLVQDYDDGRLGRFARHAIGFLLAVEHPLGIGPLEFGKLYGEDPHNIWLKALLAYSWLGFAAFLTLIVWTLAAPLRILFRARPWQPYLLCAYIVFIGHIALGSVIDMDHWRHFYLLIGLLWGAVALEQRHQLSLSKPVSPPEQPIFPLRPADRNYRGLAGSERSAAR